MHVCHTRDRCSLHNNTTEQHWFYERKNHTQNHLNKDNTCIIGDIIHTTSYTDGLVQDCSNSSCWDLKLIHVSKRGQSTPTVPILFMSNNRVSMRQGDTYIYLCYLRFPQWKYIIFLQNYPAGNRTDTCRDIWSRKHILKVREIYEWCVWS